MRIQRSLSGRLDVRQAGVCSPRELKYIQSGFTLIEMMATIAIGGILLAMAVGAWGELRESNKVEAAGEELNSLLTSARLSALSKGTPSWVTVDFSADTVASTLWGGTYSSVSKKVTGGERSTAGVDWVNSNSTGTGPFSVTGTTGFKTWEFRNRGTVAVYGASTTLAVVARSGASSKTIRLKVSGNTGRVLMEAYP